MGSSEPSLGLGQPPPLPGSLAVPEGSSPQQPFDKDSGARFGTPVKPGPPPRDSFILAPDVPYDRIGSSPASPVLNDSQAPPSTPTEVAEAPKAQEDGTRKRASSWAPGSPKEKGNGGNGQSAPEDPSVLETMRKQYEDDTDAKYFAHSELQAAFENLSTAHTALQAQHQRSLDKVQALQDAMSEAILLVEPCLKSARYSTQASDAIQILQGALNLAETTKGAPQAAEEAPSSGLDSDFLNRPVPDLLRESAAAARSRSRTPGSARRSNSVTSSTSSNPAVVNAALGVGTRTVASVQNTTPIQRASRGGMGSPKKEGAIAHTTSGGGCNPTRGQPAHGPSVGPALRSTSSALGQTQRRGSGSTGFGAERSRSPGNALQRSNTPRQRNSSMDSSTIGSGRRSSTPVENRQVGSARARGRTPTGAVLSGTASTSAGNSHRALAAFSARVKGKASTYVQTDPVALFRQIPASEIARSGGEQGAIEALQQELDLAKQEYDAVWHQHQHLVVGLEERERAALNELKAERTRRGVLQEQCEGQQKKLEDLRSLLDR